MSAQLLYGADLARYYADDLTPGPCLSVSIAHALLSRSPAHAWQLHARFGGSRRERTDEMDAGTIVHALVLGRGHERIDVIDAADFRTKAAQAAREAAHAAGRVAIVQGKLARYQDAAAAITARLHARGIALYQDSSEVVALWTERADDGTEVQCKGLLDAFPDGGVVYDLKTGDDASPTGLPRKAAQFGADMQAAAYVRGVEAARPELAGRVGFRWIHAELERPYAVTVARPSGALRELGAKKWQRAVNLWARCLREDTWPAYSEQVVDVEPAPWALAEEMGT